MLTFARLAAAPRILINTARLPRLNECMLAIKNVRATLQEINGEKRPEKTKDYFIVSNSTLCEINVIFI